MTSTDSTGTNKRDPAAVTDFIERSASMLVLAGVPRMPARVFVALLATDTGRLTSAELADQLKISPAGVSGAVRYLTQVNLVLRERRPGTRHDVYRVYDDVWFESVFHRDAIINGWLDVFRPGADILGPDTPAGRRIAETADFFAFLLDNMPALLEGWREYRDKRRAALPPPSA